MHRQSNPRPNASRIRLLLVSCATLALSVMAGRIVAAEMSAEDGFAPVFNSSADCLGIQPDGKILAGGTFTNVNSSSQNHIVRLDVNGAVDPIFSTGTGANSSVLAVAIQSDGKILIGGQFTAYNGIASPYLVRINPDGSRDATFSATFDGGGYSPYIQAIAVQPDGKILVGGYFVEVNGVAQSCIARLNADGSLDTSLAPGSDLNNTVHKIVLRPNGKILAGGEFSTEYGGSFDYIVQFNADGSVDNGFQPVVDSAVLDLALQLDGKTLIVGHFFNVNGQSQPRVARLETDGSLDPTLVAPWGEGNESTQTEHVALLPNGKILIVGPFTSIDGQPCRGLARLNIDGTVDPDFATDIHYDRPNALAVQTDGRILVGGPITEVNGIARNYLARLNADGSLDDGLDVGTGADSWVRAFSRWGDGKVVVGGDFTTFDGDAAGRVVRLNDDGSGDTAFDPGTGCDGSVYSIAHDMSGRILLGGEFTHVNGTERNRLARLNTDGSLDTTFNAGIVSEGGGPDSNIVYAVVPQSTGKILVAGTFNQFNGVNHRGIVRLNDDGSLDDTFTGTVAGGYVYTMVKNPTGGYFIGGSFTSADGQPRGGVALISSNGVLDATFAPPSGANSTVFAITPQPDGKVIIGGSFTTFNGGFAPYIARINANGTLDATFDTGTGPVGDIYAMALQADGKIIILGGFNSVDGTDCHWLGRLNANGSLDTAFDSGTGPNLDAYALLLQPDGRMLLGGNFTTFNGVARNRIARLTNPDAALSSLELLPGGDRLEATFGGSHPLANYAFWGTSPDGNDPWTLQGSLDIAADGTLSTDGLGFAVRTYVHLRVVPVFAGGQFNNSGSSLNLDAYGYAEPIPVTITGSFTAENKTFDGTTDAVISNNLLDLDNVEPGDVGNVDLNAVAAFDDAAIGTGKTVNLFNSTLTGTAAGKYAIDFTGTPTATADITGKELSVGSTFDIDQSEVLNLDGGQFTAKPKVYTLFTHPISGKTPCKATAKVLTKVSVALPQPAITTQWTKGILLYNKKSHKAAEKVGTGAATWLAAGNQDILPMNMHLATKQADPVDQALEWVQLTPPAIDSIAVQDTFPDGSYTLRIEGRWFGTKKPTVWREYTAKGAICRQRLKVTLTGDAYYLDAKEKPSYMRAENGDSALIALVPAKLPKGPLNGTVVLGNAIGLDTELEP